MNQIPTTSQDDISQTNISPPLPVKHGNPLVKILIGLLLLGIGVGVVLLLAKKNKDKTPLLSKQIITTFDDCLNAKGGLFRESSTCVIFRDQRRLVLPLRDDGKQNLQSSSLYEESTESASSTHQKKFSNTLFGFIFDYPSNLIIEETHPYEDVYMFFIGKKKDVETTFHPESLYQIIINTKKDNQELFLRNVTPDWEGKIIKRIDYKIGGYTGKKISGIFIDGTFTGEKYEYLYFIKENTMYLFLPQYGSWETPETSSLHNQILSTFKFLDN